MPWSKEELSKSCACNVTFEQRSLKTLARSITENDIEDRLLTAEVKSPPLDILIRTSGVKRLSDFLLWQVSLDLAPGHLRAFTIWQCTENTQIHFIDTYWPDIGLFDLLPIILDYQRKVWSQ
jgi:ditrans,polycis-polyprenyl diphosphate synthase